MSDSEFTALERKELRGMLSRMLKPRVYWLIFGLLAGVEVTLLCIGMFEMNLLPKQPPSDPVYYVYAGIILTVITTPVSWYCQRGPWPSDITDSVRSGDQEEGQE